MAKTIMLMDSDEASNNQIAEYIKAFDAELVVAKDGQDGYVMLKDITLDRPDLIIVCAELDKVNGFYVCKKAKSDPELMQIPFVLISSKASDQTFMQHKGLRTHADYYLKKPLRQEDFNDAMSVLLHVEPTGVAGSSQALPASADAHEESVFDFDDFEAVEGGDAKTMYSFADPKSEPAEATGGEEPLDLDDLVFDENVPAAAEVASEDPFAGMDDADFADETPKETTKAVVLEESELGDLSEFGLDEEGAIDGGFVGDDLEKTTPQVKSATIIAPAVPDGLPVADSTKNALFEDADAGLIDELDADSLFEDALPAADGNPTPETSEVSFSEEELGDLGDLDELSFASAETAGGTPVSEDAGELSELGNEGEESDGAIEAFDAPAEGTVFDFAQLDLPATPEKGMPDDLSPAEELLVEPREEEITEVFDNEDDAKETPVDRQTEDVAVVEEPSRGQEAVTITRAKDPDFSEAVSALTSAPTIRGTAELQATVQRLSAYFGQLGLLFSEIERELGTLSEQLKSSDDNG